MFFGKCSKQNSNFQNWSKELSTEMLRVEHTLSGPILESKDMRDIFRKRTKKAKNVKKAKKEKIFENLSKNNKILKYFEK